MLSPPPQGLANRTKTRGVGIFLKFSELPQIHHTQKKTLSNNIPVYVPAGHDAVHAAQTVSLSGLLHGMRIYSPAAHEEQEHSDPVQLRQTRSLVGDGAMSSVSDPEIHCDSARQTRSDVAVGSAA